MSLPPRAPSIYRIAQVALDAAIAVTSILLAFVVRFEGQVPLEYSSIIIWILMLGVPARLLIHWVFRIYNQIWRLFSLRDFWAIFQATSFYSLLLIVTARLLVPKFVTITTLPLGVAVMDWTFCISGMVLLRFLRVYQTRRQWGGFRQPSKTAKRCLLLGAGRAGAQIVRETRHNSNIDLLVVGFLDDDASKLGRQVEGVQVFGKISQLVAWVSRLQVDEVLVTIPSASSDRIQQIVDLAREEDITLKILPPVQELLLDRNLTGQIREIRLEDLLGRPEIFLDFDEVLCSEYPSAAEQVRGRSVLVTGAGGTIGSELCRQICRLNPRQLVLLGRGENSIFQIEQELRYVFPHLNLIPVIADIRNTVRISSIFQEYHPEVVFHAAAHKHVPLMERNPTEAIENNTIASANLALIAEKAGVSTFVLISTDKAVEASNFMGLSKRLAELFISTFADGSSTRFLAVRFGNVLGSRGSVIPIFQRQIAKGGPVTVTDPEMTRYFMTTPEATRLVIQSLAIGKTGQIHVLDMGQPMKIYDLAEQLIRLEGYVPGRDIEIQIMGIRPGEKLHESLVDQNESLITTAHPKIYCVTQNGKFQHDSQRLLESIKTALENKDRQQLWSHLRGISLSWK